PWAAGLFSVALVVVRFLAKRPEIIRLAVLWCSDFPLSLARKRLPGLFLSNGTEEYSKNC
ncbi:MAG: hypothetical protein ACRD43_04410, partial [Pyrinomonadaceae bacterium]